MSILLHRLWLKILHTFGLRNQTKPPLEWRVNNWRVDRPPHHTAHRGSSDYLIQQYPDKLWKLTVAVTFDEGHYTTRHEVAHYYPDSLEQAKHIAQELADRQ